MTVVPVHDETLGSYLSRLATANRLDTQALRTHITGSTRRGAVVEVDTLSVVSGQPIAVLRHAMLELNGPAELAAMPHGATSSGR